MSLWSDPSVVALQESLIGRYSLERELGRGGMAVVYLARDVKLDRPVAIKVLHQRLSADPGARERFAREAKIAARLSHPHIVPIFAVESTPTHVLIVMAVIDGETLGARIRRRGAMPADEAERVLRETAWALGYAHAHGVIHRDLTLENILLERGTGRALLADFGIAAERDVAESGPVFGTPGFLAPEVIRGDLVDHRSDVYALGVVAWTAIAGRAPFVAETSAQLLAKHLLQPVPSLGEHARGVSRRLATTIEACVAKDADARPQDIAALQALLERAPEPVAIAPALRNWFTRWERIRPMYALATPILALQTWLLVWGYLEYQIGSLLVAAAVSSVLTITAIPLVAHLCFEVSALRLLHKLGFGVHDIRAAYPLWREALEQERRRDGLPPLPGRVVFDMTVFGFVLIAVVFGIIFPNLPRWIDPSHPSISVPYVQREIVKLMSAVYLATLTGVGIGFASPGFRLQPGGRFRRLVERFWNSSLAGGITRLAGVGQRARLAASSTLHRNTELVLGLAVDDLWGAIPPHLREGLGDVPALAHTLQAAATELRALTDQLATASDALPTGHEEIGKLAMTRDVVDARHREAVTALERIRLQLLRLVASRQQTSDLTSQLEAARSLEGDLLRELAGHGEVRRMLRRPRSNRGGLSATPAETPA